MRILLLVSALLVCSTALANDSAIYGVGGAVAPMKEHPSVRMVRENVSVKLYPNSARVRCVFVFKNEGKPATVKMGFPESGYGDIKPPNKSTFKRFRSWVDGKPLKTIFLLSKTGDHLEYKGWHVKQVPFKAGQTRTVVNEYTAELGEVSDGSRFFDYALRTGRNWKGPIGEAVVTVDLSRVFKLWVPTSRTPGRVQKGNKLVWTFRDFEPDEDIRIDLTPRKPKPIGQ